MSIRRLRTVWLEKVWNHLVRIHGWRTNWAEAVLQRPITWNHLAIPSKCLQILRFYRSIWLSQCRAKSRLALAWQIWALPHQSCEPPHKVKVWELETWQLAYIICAWLDPMSPDNVNKIAGDQWRMRRIMQRLCVPLQISKVLPKIAMRPDGISRRLKVDFP